MEIGLRNDESPEYLCRDSQRGRKMRRRRAKSWVEVERIDVDLARGSSSTKEKSRGAKVQALRHSMTGQTNTFTADNVIPLCHSNSILEKLKTFDVYTLLRYTIQYYTRNCDFITLNQATTKNHFVLRITSLITLQKSP